MGSAATGIPTGAPIATSPFETSAISLCLELKNDVKGVDKDGGIAGKLQVKLIVPFLLMFFVFFQN